MKTLLLLLLLLLLICPIAAASGQSGAKAEILILGSYHMANPGHDLYNMPADDVLSPGRQGQIAELIGVLKKFRPTKIAIEADPGSSRVAQEFSDYLSGKFALSRNEIDQIGYRLAKELGHPKIYAVDADGDFPYMRVLNYAKANGLAEKFAALGAATQKRVKAQSDFLRSHTILETLSYMNSDSFVAEDVGEYFGFVPYGEPYEYAGPDLLAAWYRRNIQIYHNIHALIDSPNERILVIYGAGHLGWLRQDVSNDPTVRLRKLAEFVGENGSP